MLKAKQSVYVTHRQAYNAGAFRSQHYFDGFPLVFVAPATRAFARPNGGKAFILGTDFRPWRSVNGRQFVVIDDNWRN
jgi:hypothetical protein